LLIHAPLLTPKGFMYVWCNAYMKLLENAVDVRDWFHASIGQMWPIAEGSLSLRKTRCIRKNCTACASGEGHASYVLSGRRGSKRFSIYIPDDLAPDMQLAIENGRQLQELMNEAGVRLVSALKNQRKGKNRE
jgi:hypothetical protein